jgi:hypothetical protein
MGNPANIAAAIHATTTTRQTASNAGTRSFNPSSVPVPAAIAVAQSIPSSPQRTLDQEPSDRAWWTGRSCPPSVMSGCGRRCTATAHASPARSARSPRTPDAPSLPANAKRKAHRGNFLGSVKPLELHVRQASLKLHLIACHGAPP